MTHFILIGILLGWGAAIPIGPMNLEIIRRNLTLKTRYGVGFGLGACSADVTYLVLLAFGAILILSHPEVIRVIGVIGALILLWFGIGAWRMPLGQLDQNLVNANQSIAKHWLEGYVMTLLNPMTILFWASVSAQLATLSQQGLPTLVAVGLGVIIGTVSWVFGLNSLIHITRHKIPDSWMQYLNRIGGVLLIGFAVVCLVRVV